MTIKDLVSEEAKSSTTAKEIREMQWESKRRFSQMEPAAAEAARCNGLPWPVALMASVGLRTIILFRSIRPHNNRHRRVAPGLQSMRRPAVRTLLSRLYQPSLKSLLILEETNLARSILLSSCEQPSPLRLP